MDAPDPEAVSDDYLRGWRAGVEAARYVAEILPIVGVDPDEDDES